MTEWTYWRRFYRKFNWDAAYENRCNSMKRWLEMKPPFPPKVMVAMEARMILDAHYRGRWKCVWGVFTDAFWCHYHERYAPFWEWFRTRVLRRPRNPDLVLIDRMDEEEAALDEVMGQL
jgi:hypothetical protein